MFSVIEALYFFDLLLREFGIFQRFKGEDSLNGRGMGAILSCKFCLCELASRIIAAYFVVLLSGKLIRSLWCSPSSTLYHVLGAILFTLFTPRPTLELLATDFTDTCYQCGFFACIGSGTLSILTINSVSHTCSCPYPYKCLHIA